MFLFYWRNVSGRYLIPYHLHIVFILATTGPAVCIILASYCGCNRTAAMIYFIMSMALMGGYCCGMKVCLQYFNICFKEFAIYKTTYCCQRFEMGVHILSLLIRKSWFQVNCLDIAPNNIATVTSVSNTASTLTGIISPYLVGLLTPDVSYFLAFVYMSNYYTSPLICVAVEHWSPLTRGFRP